MLMAAMILNSCSDDTKCESAADCKEGELCRDGVCAVATSTGQCTSAATCPGEDNECQTRTCNGGLCGMDHRANGTAINAQAEGDCRQVVCDGQGATRSQTDDNDIREDGNPCTVDGCEAGEPVHAIDVGRACGSSEGMFCDASGICVGCVDSSDCPGAETECQARTCSSNACGLSYVEAGTVIANQVEGDCHRNVCDGAGGIRSDVDDADLPMDGKACTDDVCTAGSPSHPPKESGTACNEGGGEVCNGVGVCVQCVAADACPGVDNECQTRTCDAGLCGFSFVTAGEAVVSGQNEGDCHRKVCDGSGGTRSDVDDNDIPVDSYDCTDDLCTAGTPSNPPKTAGVSCGAGSGMICDGSGACIGCVNANTCPGVDNECQTRTCTASSCGFAYVANGTAVFAQTAGDCRKKVCDGAGGTRNDIDDTDVADDGKACTENRCIAGTPSHPPVGAGTACSEGGGSVCNGTGVCVGCVSPSTCPGVDNECQTRTCIAGSCGFSYVSDGTVVTAQTAGDCHKKVCDGAGGLRNGVDNLDVPNDGKACTDDVCTAGVPSNPAKSSGTACNEGGGSVCNGIGLCVGCVSPSTCPGVDNECQTRTCIAGSCGLSYVANGTAVSAQTAGDCRKRICNGSGATVDQIDGTDTPEDLSECIAGICAGGVPSTEAQEGAPCGQGGMVCNTAGACVAGHSIPITWCNLVWPRPAYSGAEGVAVDIYGQLYTAGTAPAGALAGILAKTCYSDQPIPADTEISSLTCVAAQFNADAANNDEYVASVNFPVGTYNYVFAFSGNNGANWQLCDADDDISNSLVPGVATITPSPRVTEAIATNSTTVMVTFSQPIDPDNAPASAFTFNLGLTATATSVGGSVVTVTTSIQDPGLIYTLTVSNSVKGANGNRVIAPNTATFGGSGALPPCSRSQIVISQIYGGGGNTGAPYKNDFVELHNRSVNPVTLSNWSIQQASATGSTWNSTTINATIAGGGYLLVKWAGGANGSDLPPVEATGAANMGGSGKVALFNTTTVYGASCPSGITLVDFVGVGGTVNCWEGWQPTPAGSNTTALIRLGDGCTDTGDNSVDFTAAAPNPRNGSSPPVSCGCL